MAVKIRLARGGAKKKPYYRIVVANATAPRDGDFLEKVGTYNPLLPKGEGNRVTLKAERITYWLSQGAIPSDRVATLISASGITLPKSIVTKIAIKVKARKPKEIVQEVETPAPVAEKVEAVVPAAAPEVVAPAALVTEAPGGETVPVEDAIPAEVAPEAPAAEPTEIDLTVDEEAPIEIDLTVDEETTEKKEG